MNELILSCLISFVVTILLALIQTSYDSKNLPVKYFFTPNLFFYILIMSFGNIVTTLFAAGILDGFTGTKVKQTDVTLLKGPHWIWYCFLGVFGFEILIKRINISFYGKGVLSINDWITKAKAGAVAAALKNGVNLQEIEAQHCGRQLFEKYKDTPNQIHTLANTNLGEEYNDIILDIETKPQVNLELQLCYVIASKFPQVGKAALKK